MYQLLHMTGLQNCACLCVYIFTCVSDKKVCLCIMGLRDLDSVDSEAPQGASIEPPASSDTHTQTQGECPHGGQAPHFTNTNHIEWLDAELSTRDRWRDETVSIKKSHVQESHMQGCDHTGVQSNTKTHSKHRGEPSGNQQPIRIIWPVWWKVCPIHNLYYHKRSQLSPHAHSSSSAPVWIQQPFLLSPDCSPQCLLQLRWRRQTT